MINGVRLGATATDAETDGQPSPSASLDNTTGSNDENGVAFSPLVQGGTATFAVTASGTGVLNAWADWNHNGVFDANERIFTDQALVAGSNALTINIPPGAVLGDTAFRFRVTGATGQGGDSPTGLATTGEVEDYFAQILPTTGSSIGDRVWLDENGNGVQDAGEAGIPNQLVTLTGADSNGNAVALTTYTDANGGYVFSGLPASNPSGYTITVTPAAGLNPTYDENGTGTANATTLVLAAGR